MIKTELLASALFIVLCHASWAGENVPQTQRLENGDWASYRLCGSAGDCYWRAATFSSSGQLFALDFPEYKKNKPMALFVDEVPLSAMQTWDTDNDRISGKLRVDLNPIRSCTINRQLDRALQTLFSYVPESVANSSFIDQLKFGTTLRYRQVINGNNYTCKFSLRGASAAITRAEREAKAAYDRTMNGYDPYFDGPLLNNKQPKQEMPKEVYF